jgi:hypothetical protein
MLRFHVDPGYRCVKKLSGENGYARGGGEDGTGPLCAAKK